MSKRLLIFAAYWSLALLLFPFEYAWAYIDPATTTYIIQIAAAIVITLGVSLGIFLYKLQMIVTNVKVSIHAFFKRLGSRKKGVGQDSEGRAGKDTSFLSEDEALAQGVIDYPIPVRETYPALAEEWVSVVPEKDEADKKASLGESLRSFGQGLWGDDRGFGKRFLIAISLAAAISVTFIIFSIFDSVISNRADMSFSFAQIIEPVVTIGLIVFAAIAVFLCLFRGRVFNLFSGVLLALLIAGYLQITFFNKGMGQLLGNSLDWEALGIVPVITNLIVWTGIFLLVLYLGLSRKKGSRRVFTGAALFVPLLLVAIQGVALASIIPPTEHWDDNNNSGEGYVLTANDMYKLSSEKNTLVFVLDTLDNVFIDEVLQDDPDFFDALEGFTHFTNNVGRHNSTYPAVANMLTGEVFTKTDHTRDYAQRAYGNGAFLPEIRERGYRTGVFIDEYGYFEAKNLTGLADNVKDTSASLKTDQVVKHLFKLSALKSVPLAFKEHFFLDGNAFSFFKAYRQQEHQEPYVPDDPLFYKNLKEQGLSATYESPYFGVYHFNGSHHPFIMNAESQFVEEGTDALQQTKGSFHTLIEFFDEMKELGIYEDATIIITGDHAVHYLDNVPFREMTVGLFVKPAGSAEEPLKTSDDPVSIDNIRATVIQAAGGPSDAWGQTYFEVGSDGNPARYYFHRYTDEGGKHHLIRYRIDGHARDWNSWTLEENMDIKDEDWQ